LEQFGQEKKGLVKDGCLDIQQDDIRQNDIREKGICQNNTQKLHYGIQDNHIQMNDSWKMAFTRMTLKNCI
jgi:hypothetical protein